MLENAGVKSDSLFDHRRYGEVFLGAKTTGSTHFSSEIGTVKKYLYPVREFCGCSYGYQKACSAILHHLREAAHGRGDDGQAGCHGFEGSNSEALIE